MNQPIKITRKQANKILSVTFPDYSGRKISVCFQEKITFYDTNWGGGSKNDYKFLNVNGEMTPLPTPAPWNNPFEGQTIEIPPHVLVVCHQYFCGHDMGIKIYSNPQNAPKWLTA